MAITNIIDPLKFKDQNDQISNGLKDGKSLNDACAEAGLSTDFITKQMHALMGNSLFNQSDDIVLGWGGKLQYDGQTQCGVYTVATGGRAKIDIDLNGDGVISEDEKEVDAAQAMAASYDSVLDLYIEDSIQKFIREELNGDTSFWWDGRGFMTEEAQKRLMDEYGIKVTQVGEDRRTYSFSLVDENGNVVEDANGKKASILWGDWVIPDGYAQGAELNLSSILDSIGYDCISKADFVFNEELGGEEAYNEMIKALHTDAANTLDLTSSSAYTGEESKYMQISKMQLSQMYGATKIISLASGGGSSKIDNAIFDALIDFAIENDIDIEELIDEKDSFEKAKEKVKKAIIEKTGTEETIKNIEDNTKALLEAVEAYQEKFEEISETLEEGEEIDIEELAEEIADKYEIDIQDLLEEIE